MTKQSNIPITTIQVVIIHLSQYLGLKKPRKKTQKATIIVVPIFLPLAKYARAITEIISNGQGNPTIKFFMSV